MPKLFIRLGQFIAALICGVVLGFFVLNLPIIPAATETVIHWLAPYAKNIDAELRARGMEFVLLPSLIFIAQIPNILVVSALVAITMEFLRSPRAVFYGTLVWPVLSYLVDAVRLLRIRSGLVHFGLNSDLSGFIRAEHLHTKAVGTVLIYCFFQCLSSSYTGD